MIIITESNFLPSREGVGGVLIAVLKHELHRLTRIFNCFICDFLSGKSLFKVLTHPLPPLERGKDTLRLTMPISHEKTYECHLFT